MIQSKNVVTASGRNFPYPAVASIVNKSRIIRFHGPKATPFGERLWRGAAGKSFPYLPVATATGGKENPASVSRPAGNAFFDRFSQQATHTESFEIDYIDASLTVLAGFADNLFAIGRPAGHRRPGGEGSCGGAIRAVNATNPNFLTGSRTIRGEGDARA